ncbi:MAG: hypothetical protein EA378_05935 [Phycisphaerales bacterium]|nr:MAG: hypothetical protein EA378_05935 [Phycisphaerales bacterium]
MAKKRRRLVLQRPDPDNPPALLSLGKPADVAEAMAPYNTAPDGGTKSLGTLILYGPGITVELPTSAPQVNQAMVTVVDEESAWPVLSRMCKANDWKMIDPDTGRSFG